MNEWSGELYQNTADQPVMSVSHSASTGNRFRRGRERESWSKDFPRISRWKWWVTDWIGMKGPGYVEVLWECAMAELALPLACCIKILREVSVQMFCAPRSLPPTGSTPFKQKTILQHRVFNLFKIASLPWMNPRYRVKGCVELPRLRETRTRT